MHDLALLIAGFLAALIGTMSGGGAGLIALFTLLWLGIPINQAIATNKFGDLGFFLPAVRNFTRAKQINKKALPLIIVINLIGVTIGTFMIVKFNASILNKLIAAILVIIIISLLHKKDYALKERPAHWYWPGIYLTTSVSSGTLGAGTGILNSLALMYFRGFTALRAMANSFYASMFGSVLSVGILLFAHLINYRYGLFLFIGNLIGSHIGSSIAIKKGNGFVRIMIMLMALFVIVQRSPRVNGMLLACITIGKTPSWRYVYWALTSPCCRLSSAGTNLTPAPA